MPAAVRPEVLANDWIPPVAIGRCREVDEVVRRLDAPHPHAPPPWIVGIRGPPGSGTSTVARRAARETVERIRSSTAGPPPRWWGVRVGALRGTHGVATALLQRLDEGFDGRGFPTAEILAGFLRRVRRDGRPCVLVLDDLSGSEPDLAPVLRALGRPDRFLPEGENGLPPFWTIVAGAPEALSRLDGRVRDRNPLAPFVDLVAYDPRTLGLLVRDRAERLLGRPPNDREVRQIVERAIEDGGGATRAIDLLRREALRAAWPALGRSRGVPIPPMLSIEARVVSAIGTASRGGAAPLGEVKRCEADLARAEGVRPLPTTTLWRRIIRLERAGYVRREIRTGGNGGTRSLVRVLTPIDEWVTVPSPRDSPRAVAPFAVGTAADPGSSRAPAADRPGWSIVPPGGSAG